MKSENVREGFAEKSWDTQQSVQLEVRLETNLNFSL
jgi:hypothetical protein